MTVAVGFILAAMEQQRRVDRVGYPKIQFPMNKWTEECAMRCEDSLCLGNGSFYIPARPQQQAPRRPCWQILRQWPSYTCSASNLKGSVL